MSSPTGLAMEALLAVILLTVSVCQSADTETSQVEGPAYDNLSHTGDNSSESEDETHEVHRYKVAVVDFAAVASPFLISAVVLCASLAKIGFHLNNKLSSVFPESCLLIVIGVVVGLILFFSPVENYEMQAHTFFLFLLPPIVLEAGYFMPARSFFDNLGTILLFAVVGTLFNTLLIGLTLWGLSTTSAFATGEISVLHCLVFSSLLSAVDPVAVLAVFEEIHVNEVLFIVVFGESLLNDAVTVVLYHMFETFSEIGESHIQAVDIVSGVCSFFVVGVCGTLIGVVFGFLTGFMSRFTAHVRVIEPLLVFVMGYLSYLTAEIFHFSGILACVFCGITMKKYVEKNISQKSHTTIKYFMKMLASVCETIIFMYLGISTVSRYHHWESGFVLLTLIACLVYRSIGVVSLSAIANKFRLIKLSQVDQFIMSYGGLRGAIAFSLVVLLKEETFPHRNLFITTAVVVIYFTVFIQGTTIKPLVNVLRVKKSDKRKPTMNEKLNERLVDHLMAGIEDMIGRHGHHEIRERFEYIDNKYIKPLLVREKQNITRGRSILEVYQKLVEKDAQDHLSRNGSFLIPRPSSLAQMLSLYNNSQNAGTPYLSLDHTNTQSASIPMPDRQSGTCLDMRAFDGQSEQPMIHMTDSSIHHVLDDNMFTPRKTFSRHTRHMLQTTSNHPAFHHNARLHLRKLLSQKHKHKDRRPSTPHIRPTSSAAELGASNKPRKNVSFVNQVTIRIEEATPPNSKSALETKSVDTEEESGSETGITFTVGPADDEPDSASPEAPPLSPTVAETTLPWKCMSSSPPVSSRHHSQANLQDALQETLPSWITEEQSTPLILKETAPSDLGSVNYAHGVSRDEISPVAISPAVAVREPHSEEGLPLPWKSDDQEATPSHQPAPLQPGSFQLKPEGHTPECESGTLPPPWRHQSAPNLQSTPADARLDSPIRTEVELDSNPEDVIPAPWKNNGSVSSNSNDPSHSLPWRQVCSSPQQVIRTSSVAATLDSLYPHPSTQSFRVSEAESHHSLHLHMHHLIDPITLLTHHPHEDTQTELELEQVDMEEFISNWILSLNPDPTLPVHDHDLDCIEISGACEQETSDGEVCTGL